MFQEFITYILGLLFPITMNVTPLSQLDDCTDPENDI